MGRNMTGMSPAYQNRKADLTLRFGVYEIVKWILLYDLGSVPKSYCKRYFTILGLYEIVK